MDGKHFPDTVFCESKLDQTGGIGGGGGGAVAAVRDGWIWP